MKHRVAVALTTPEGTFPERPPRVGVDRKANETNIFVSSPLQGNASCSETCIEITVPPCRTPKKITVTLHKLTCGGKNG